MCWSRARERVFRQVKNKQGGQKGIARRETVGERGRCWEGAEQEIGKGVRATGRESSGQKGGVSESL